MLEVILFMQVNVMVPGYDNLQFCVYRFYPIEGLSVLLQLPKHCEIPSMEENIRRGQRVSKTIMGLIGRLWSPVVGVGDETESGLNSSAGVAHFVGLCSCGSYEDSL